MTRVSSCDRSLSQHFPAGSLAADRGSSSHTFRVQQGHKLEVIVCFQQQSHQWNSIVSVQEAETHTACQRECSLWGCKYLGLFAESFTADLFLHSQDLHACCLLHGKSFRKSHPCDVVRCFAVAHAVFSSKLCLMSYWNSNHTGVMKAVLWLVEAHMFAFSTICNSCAAISNPDSFTSSVTVHHGWIDTSELSLIFVPESSLPSGVG